MNKILVTLPVLATLIFMLSCKKQGAQSNSSATKTIKFILYTNKDFSGVNDTINFSLTIKNKSKITLFDSALTAMRIKDIPGPASKMIFQKTVHDDGSILIAGFNYSIKNVGFSWFLDTVAVSEKLKDIEYPFQ